MRRKLVFSLSLFAFICNSTFAQDAVYSGITLVGDQPTAGLDSYGTHVASNSEWLMIGAPREDIDFDNDGLDPTQGDVNVGAVYVYKRTASGPVLHQRIEGEGNNVGPTPGIGDRFGAGIVLEGNIMFVGAANDNDFPGVDPDNGFLGGPFSFAGKVYVFDLNAGTGFWELTQKLTSDAPNSGGSFGARTESSHMELFSFSKGKGGPKIALIGEIENGTGRPPTLHVFKRKNKKSSWERIQIVGNPSGVADASFADSVESVANFALVNESAIDPNLDPRAVHVYRIDEDGIVPVGGAPMPIQTLLSPNGPNDRSVCGNFGYGVGMDAADDIAVIGDPCDNTLGQRAGAVFVYSVNNNGNNDPLSLVDTLTSPNAAPDGLFAGPFANGKQGVTTDGNLIAVGSASAGINFGVAQDDVHLYARDPGADTFSLVDSEPSPAPGIPFFEGYGQSVTLLGDNELAIGQLSDDTTGTLKGRVFLFDIQ